MDINRNKKRNKWDFLPKNRRASETPEKPQPPQRPAETKLSRSISSDAADENFIQRYAKKNTLSKVSMHRLFMPPIHRKKVSAKKRVFEVAKIFSICLLITLIAIIALSGSYAIFKIHFLNKKISIENSIAAPPSVIDSAISIVSSLSNRNRTELKGEKDGRINILLLGIAGEVKPGTNLTDTMMIMSINTKTKKVALLSLPRDLYVKVPDYGYETKINSIYPIGVNQKDGAKPLIRTIEKITGLPIHYHFILNFDGFKEIVNDIGGITVNNERDIYDPKYPGPNYSYEVFSLKQGLCKLDGETALKYARQRHGDPEGDFGRAKRQQQVIQAIKNKVFSTRTFLNIFTVSKLIETLGDNLKTDASLEEIESFMKLSQGIDTQNITNAVVDAWKKESLLRVSHIYYEGGTRAFILIPRVGNFSEVQDLAANIFDLDAINKRKQAIDKEDAKIAIINYTQYSGITKSLENVLGDSGFKNVSTIENISLPKLAPDSTLVLDMSSGQKPFSLDEIIKKNSAILSTDTSLAREDESTLRQYDLIILVGNDQNNYKFDQQTMDQMSEEDYEEMYKDMPN